jgi:hypothetical protein
MREIVTLTVIVIISSTNQIPFTITVSITISLIFSTELRRAAVPVCVTAFVDLTTFQILGQKLSNFFVGILVETMTPKGHFEIN